MEPLTGFATALEPQTAADAFVTLIQLLLGLGVLLFIAICWFCIGRRAGVENSWLAFVPLIGMIVPWRVARAPLWTLIAAIGTALVLPVIGVLAIFSIVSLVMQASGGEPFISSIIAIVVLVLAAIALLLLDVAIKTFWSIRSAQHIGFSTWVGALASPLMRLIPFGQIIRVVFLGLLAFKRKPL